MMTTNQQTNQAASQYCTPAAGGGTEAAAEVVHGKQKEQSDTETDTAALILSATNKQTRYLIQSNVDDDDDDGQKLMLLLMLLFLVTYIDDIRPTQGHRESDAITLETTDDDNNCIISIPLYQQATDQNQHRMESMMGHSPQGTQCHWTPNRGSCCHPNGIMAQDPDDDDD